MNRILKNIVRWFCSRLTENQFHSVLIYLLEIANGEHRDIHFRPEPTSPHFREFSYDQVRPLTSPPDWAQEKPAQKKNWKELCEAYEKTHGKALKPVKRRSGSLPFPEHLHCEHCGAPSHYLYLNDGKVGNQVRCKVCNGLSQTEHVRRKQAKYYCPHCGKALFLWKQHEHEDIYKCQNPQCSHYLANKGKLTPAERKRLEANIYDPNFKLHYQYREYHFHSSDLKCARPDSTGPSLLSSIRSSYHTVGLVLSLFMNVGLSSRQTREVLKGLFGIRLSHQTVLNYVKASAAIIAPWLDRNLPKPGHHAAADETYITVEDEQHYTWFVIDELSRAICGYNLSNTRGAVPALATIYNAYGPPEDNLHRRFILAKDGLGSYNDAIMAYNQHSDKNIIFGKTVVGLSNHDDVSEKYRSLKQLIERLNRTYKYHTRPRAGFKSMSGAIDLTVLFVAYYNFLRTHSSLHSVPIPIPELQNVESFPKQWEILIRKAAA